MTDFSPEDDGYFTCAVSVQHKVSQGAGKEGRSEEGGLTGSVIVLISSKVTAGGRTFSTFTVDMNLSDSSALPLQLVFLAGKIQCKSLKCDLSPEVKLSKIPFSVALINDS